MEKKFGEFYTVEELNRAAAAQKEEGDIEALYALAKENGIDEGTIQDYEEGYTEELTTPSEAAMAKIRMETEELNLKSQLKDWSDIIQAMCLDDRFARAVFRPEKKLEDVLAIGLKRASATRVAVDARICRKAGLGDGRTYIGMIGKTEWKKIVEEYYCGGER